MRIPCSISHMIFLGKKVMKNEIDITLGDDEIFIWKDSGEPIEYRYSKLNLNEYQLNADGLRIDFQRNNQKNDKILQLLKDKINQKKEEKERRSSTGSSSRGGPSNTLNSNKKQKKPTIEKPDLQYSSPKIMMYSELPKRIILSESKPTITPPRSYAKESSSMSQSQTNMPPKVVEELPKPKHVKDNTSKEGVVLPLATLKAKISLPSPTQLEHSVIEGKRKNFSIFHESDLISKKQFRLKSAPVQGIPNLGNTCFIAAVIQALCSLKNYVDDMLSPFWLSLCPPSLPSSSRRHALRSATNSSAKPLLETLLALLQYKRQWPSFLILYRDVRCLKSSFPSISDVKDSITGANGKYRGFSQHDAHELLTDLISLLEAEQIDLLKKTLSDTCYESQLGLSTVHVTANAMNLPGDIPPLYMDTIATIRRLLSVIDVTLRCTNCNELRHKKVVHHLSVISLRQEQYHDYSLLLSFTESPTSLNTLLSSFFSTDKRDLACEKCKIKDAQVEVTTKIEKFPDVLIFQLKRFEFNAKINDYTKIATSVIFPLGLDMSPYGSDERSVTNLNCSTLQQDFFSVFPQLPKSEENGKSLESDAQDSLLDMNVPLSLSNSTVIESKSHPIEEPPSWICSVCTYLNQGTYLCCEICGGIRDEELSESEKDIPLVPAEQLDNPFYYNLVAVVRHIGRNAFSAHYTCDALHKEDDSKQFHWYRCDDSSVTQISKDAVLSQQTDPYLLFYQRNIVHKD